MATYAIGDVHGCYDTLRRLVARLRFDPRRDRLWFVGDLVNRGPESLAVLRWVIELGDAAVVVLGNHDLHLLARAWGVAEPRRRDSLEEVLDAPDRDDLLRWLKTRPLLHRENGFLLVHAGLFPSWTPTKAERLAIEVEAALVGERGPDLVAQVKRKRPLRWRKDLAESDRHEAALAGFTSLRVLDDEGRTVPDFSGAPELAPRGCRPWFAFAERRSRDEVVIFGHWAALGLELAPGLACLDTGCAWGRTLTALRLEDRELFQEAASEG
jgi:bis(5'-nucleosyl)-tetraphosphatase (symmetrical)